MVLSSRKQARQQANTFGLKPKKWNGYVGRISLKVMGLNRREVDIAKRKVVLIEGKKGLAKCETIVAARIEKAKDRGASAGEMLELLE